MRRLLAVAGAQASVLALLIIQGFLGAGMALAEPPLRADDQITDHVDALGGDQGRVQDALDQLRDEDVTQLFVVFVASFDDVDGQTWADQSARQSQLGTGDVLFAVAIDDRAYGISVDQDFPLSDSELADLTANDVEPLLGEQDWAGAAIALAEGLNGGAGINGGVAVALLLGGLAVGAGGYVLYRHRRRVRTEGAASDLAALRSRLIAEYGFASEELSDLSRDDLMAIDLAARDASQLDDELAQDEDLVDGGEAVTGGRGSASHPFAAIESHADPAVVTAAVHRVVNVEGLDVLADPGRLRALLMDELGSEGRRHRAAVDAISGLSGDVGGRLLHAPADQVGSLLEDWVTTQQHSEPALARWASAATSAAPGISTTPADPYSTPAAAPPKTGPTTQTGPARARPAIPGPAAKPH